MSTKQPGTEMGNWGKILTAQVLWTLADAGRSSVECVTSGAVFNFFAPELRGLENVDNNSVYRAVPLWGSSGAIYSATATVPSSKQAVSITLIIPVYIIIFNRKILASLKTIEKGKKSRSELRKEQGPIMLLSSEGVKAICLCSSPSKGNPYCVTFCFLKEQGDY